MMVGAQRSAKLSQVRRVHSLGAHVKRTGGEALRYGSSCNQRDYTALPTYCPGNMPVAECQSADFFCLPVCRVPVCRMPLVTVY